MNFFKNIYNSFYNIKPTNNLNTFSDGTPDATGVAGETVESPKKTLEKKQSCLWRMPFFQISLKNVIRTPDYIFQLDNYQYYFFHIFILYNNIVTLKQYVCKSLYNISFIKMIIDIGNVIYKKNYNNMFKIRVEPYMNSWINISIIEKKKYDYFSFIDKLVFFDNMIPLSIFRYKSLKPVIKHSKTYNYKETYFCENKEKTELYREYTYFNSFFRKNSCYDILLIMKYDNIYKIKHVPSKDKTLDIIEKKLDISLIPSNVSFIIIEYSHSKNSKYSISLELPKSMFIVGNEILSAGFVMRYLEHTVGAGVFDMNYTLNIIDNNINQFKMRNNQYCLLEMDSYKIIDI